MASAQLTESTVAAPSRRPRRGDPRLDHPPSSELVFPGCKPVPLPREALETWEGPCAVRKVLI